MNAGYSRWADSNQIIVLYPQTIDSDLPPVYNPRGCWDWWGYDDPDYAKQSGRQMRAVKLMLDRLASGYSGATPRLASNLTAETTWDRTATLQWTRSHGPRLGGYNVYYSANPEGPFARAGTTKETQATVAGLASGTTYSFMVRAVSRRNVESADSNLASAATPGLPPLPDQLTPVVALIPSFLAGGSKIRGGERVHAEALRPVERQRQHPAGGSRASSTCALPRARSGAFRMARSPSSLESRYAATKSSWSNEAVREILITDTVARHHAGWQQL